MAARSSLPFGARDVLEDARWGLPWKRGGSGIGPEERSQVTAKPGGLYERKTVGAFLSGALHAYQGTGMDGTL